MSITHAVIPVEAGELPLTVARAGASGAAVVIAPSAFGVAPDLEAQMEELAQDARVVVAIDPFCREQAGPLPYDDMARMQTRFQRLDRARTYRDLRAAIDWLRASEAGLPVVLLGICFGGSYALLAAADAVADAVVTWHGTRMEQSLERAAEMRCPMRLHFGGADPFVTPEAVQAVAAAFSGRADVQVVVHPGATHGFSHPAAPRSFDAAAERAGMAAVRELCLATRTRSQRPQA